MIFSLVFGLVIEFGMFLKDDIFTCVWSSYRVWDVFERRYFHLCLGLGCVWIFTFEIGYIIEL
jgi:hypothetical protein